MSEEQLDDTQNSSSALSEALASSPEVQQEAQENQGTQTETAQQSDTQDKNVPFNEHPRFKEVIEERNSLRQQNERLMEMMQRSIPQPQLPQPNNNPYAGMTPDEERFWREVDQRAERIAEAKLQKINPALQAGAMELANLKVEQFRKEHPDIKADSPEEIAIARKINAGYKAEDAYRAVMWDKKFAEAENRGNINQKQRIEAKKQANVEQRSIPQNSMPPVKSKYSLREEIERNARELGF